MLKNSGLIYETIAVNLLITFPIFVLSQRLIARNVLELFSFNRVASMMWVEGPFPVTKFSQTTSDRSTLVASLKLCFVLCFTQRQRRWPWHPPGQYGASTHPMALSSGFAWSHRYALSGDVHRGVSSQRHGRPNRHRIRYIVLHRI
jgi:hypothetical protein